MIKGLNGKNMVKPKFKAGVSVVFSLLLTVAILCLSSFNEENYIALAIAGKSSEINNQLNSTAKQSVFKEKVYINATLEDEFCDDSVIVVLDENISSLSATGNSKKLGTMFSDISLSSIKDLSALPDNFLTKEGTIDTKNTETRELAKHFERVEFNQILKIELKEKSKQNVLDTIKQIEKIDGVVCVEPNYIGTSTISNPNDPEFRSGNQWALNGTYGINAPDAWDITTGLTSVRVGVIDSGIAVHNDLTNVVAGWDFYNNNAITTDDDSGHGTSVAGIIGATGNNGMGVSGVAQQVTLVPLQTVTGGSDQHDYSYIIEAIKYARNLWGTNQQIDILNMSISGFGTWGASLAEIQKFPGLFVWAAGNSGDNLNNFSNIGRFKLPNLISVGAHNKDGARSVWNSFESSSYGSNAVDIYAPGGKGAAQNNENIITTHSARVNSYRYFNGTSSSAPMVAGVAALVKAKYDCDAAAIKRLIVGNADDITIKVPGGFLGLGTTNQSVKRLNAFGALEEKEIYTAQQLSDVRNNPYAHYKLMSNINLSGWNWNPIPEFYGILNGNGKTISNLSINHGTITGSDNYGGLFGKNYGDIFWFNMTNVSIEYGIDHGSPFVYIGAVVGKNEHIVHSVIVSGDIRVNRKNSSSGGIAGTNTGHIGNCTVSIDTWVNGDVGGVAGTNTGYIGGCTVTNSDISHYYVQWNARIGGIVGYCNNGVVNDCTVSSSIIQNTGSDGTSSRQPYMGKIVGHITNSELGNLAATNITLGQGSLGTNNLQNFGAANWPSFFPSSWAKAAGRESNLVCWW